MSPCRAMSTEAALPADPPVFSEAAPIPQRRFTLVGILYFAFVAWSIYGALVPVETYLFRMVHMAFIFALGFVVCPASKNAPKWTRGLDIAFAVAGVVTIAYALLDLDSFIRRSTIPEPIDFWLGLIAILLVVELSRRIVGTAFTVVLVGFLLYVYLGR